MIHVGRIAKQLRESLGLTQQEVARALGITNVHVSNIENEKSFPSQNLIDRYREFFEVDLYVLAWCECGDLDRLPRSIREPASQLARACKERFAESVERIGRVARNAEHSEG